VQYHWVLLMYMQFNFRPQNLTNLFVSFSGIHDSQGLYFYLTFSPRITIKKLLNFIFAELSFKRTNSLRIPNVISYHITTSNRNWRFATKKQTEGKDFLVFVIRQTLEQGFSDAHCVLGMSILHKNVWI
jgi:hypothetical protein